MAKDSDQLVVAANGSINIAPVGTAVQTDPAQALSATFRELGYATEDGVTFGDSVNIEKIMGWQSANALRPIVTGRERSIETVLQQWNDATLPAVLGGGAWSNVSGSIYKFTPPADTDALQELCVVVDWADGSRHFRWVGYNCSATSAFTTQLTRTGASVLPVTFELNTNDNGDDYNIYSDDPVFAAGGS